MRLGLFAPLLMGAVSCGLATAAEAQEIQPIVRRLSVQDCVREALAHNRDIQIERFNPRIARFALDAARGVYDPLFMADTRRMGLIDDGGLDPNDMSKDRTYDTTSVTSTLGLQGLLPTGMSYSLEGDYANTYGFRQPQNVDSYNLYAGVTVQQPLLRDFWIDASRLTIRVNRKNLRITELGVMYMSMDIVNQAVQAYYDLVLARQEVRVQEKLLEVRKRFEADTRQQVAVGRLSNLDEKLALAETANVEVDVLVARQAVYLAANALKTLLGDDFKSSADVILEPTEGLAIIPETFSLQQSWQRGLDLRPDLAQMRLDVEKADLDLKYRYNQLFPYLNVVGSYGRKGASTSQEAPPTSARASASDAFDEILDGVAPNNMIGAIFSIPLSRARERADYRSSRELRQQFQVRVKQREEWVLREVDDAYRTVQATLDRVAATGRAVEAAEAAVRAEEQKLAAGRSTPFFVLSLQGDLATAQSAELRARTEYFKACSQLQFADGSILERHGVALERR